MKKQTNKQTNKQNKKPEGTFSQFFFFREASNKLDNRNSKTKVQKCFIVIITENL